MNLRKYSAVLVDFENAPRQMWEHEESHTITEWAQILKDRGINFKQIYPSYKDTGVTIS